MSDSCSIKFCSREGWLEITDRFCDTTYRHSSAYADRFAARQGAECEYAAVCKDSEIVGAATVRTKRVPVLGGGIAYITRGPLTRRGVESDAENLGGVLDALRTEYVDTRNLVLRIQAGLGPAEWNSVVEGAFLERGFSPTDRASKYRTILLDIDRPLEEIRKSLAKKWRYELTKSEKAPTEIRFVADDESYRRFQKIFNDFVTAKGFFADPDADFLAPVQAELGAGEKLKIGLAECEGQIVSGGLWGMLGDTAVWVLGASTLEGLENRAAYRLQWETIALAKESGMKWYDLGGINPESNPGVYHFKKGLGGEDLTAPGPFEAIPKSLRGKLTLQCEGLYKKIRGGA